MNVLSILIKTIAVFDLIVIAVYLAETSFLPYWVNFGKSLCRRMILSFTMRTPQLSRCP